MSNSTSDPTDDARALRPDPADHLCARARLVGIEAGKTWHELERAS